jgi:hypothetical protein
VANLKSIFSKASLRKNRRFAHFESNNIMDGVLYPCPVLIRWNTWFEAVKYIWKYYCNTNIRRYGMFRRRRDDITL